MRILLVSPTLPHPPTSGGALRVSGLLHGLARAGHSVTLFALGDSSLSPADPLGSVRIIAAEAPQRTRWKRIAELLFSRRADIESRLYCPVAAGRLEELLREERFDVVQIEGLEMASYLPAVRRAAPGIPLCLDTFNAEADLQRTITRIDRQQPKRWAAALYSWIQSRRLLAFEKQAVREADLVLAVSEADAGLLNAYLPRHPVQVIPNGINTSLYQRASDLVAEAEPRVVFMGKMDYRPNVDAVRWFADAIWPAIRDERSEARWWVVGQRPVPAIQALGDRDGITVTGEVPTVLPYLAGNPVFVAPLRMGSGTRLKILEAMAAGCAVVTTPLGASGLDRETCTGLVIAESATDLADRVTELLAMPEARARLGASAREIVSQRYDWQVIIPRVLAAYAGIGLPR
jgi:polysaccharide biosynthesis protein PslH